MKNNYATQRRAIQKLAEGGPGSGPQKGDGSQGPTHVNPSPNVGGGSRTMKWPQAGGPPAPASSRWRSETRKSTPSFMARLSGDKMERGVIRMSSRGAKKVTTETPFLKRASGARKQSSQMQTLADRSAKAMTRTRNPITLARLKAVQDFAATRAGQYKQVKRNFRKLAFRAAIKV